MVTGRMPGQEISIHALREEGDFACRAFLRLRTGFLSTPSARRATARLSELLTGKAYFYPRPPRGGRPEQKQSTALREVFLSTPSARRATVTPKYSVSFIIISIHALREEGDSV